MKHYFIVGSIMGLCFANFTVHAQFAPPVGQPGTTAMYKDSSAFIAWANQATVVRGYQDISSPTLGYANVGDNASATGNANSNVVSLGDGGSCTVQFVAPVVNGSGPDFAVFENSFDDTFLELAFVEVSSDGGTFFRFPATSNTDATTQTNSFGPTDATNINNLAGKYKGLYGTPFDLDDIPDNLLLNKMAITHVRIVDVIGCIQDQYCSRDANNNKINDPWPTAFGSGGFDLDAVGVIHQQAVGIEELELADISAYPNPATDILYVSLSANYNVIVSNIIGEIIMRSENRSNTSSLPIQELKQGVYVLTIISNGKQKQVKFIKQ